MRVCRSTWVLITVALAGSVAASLVAPSAGAAQTASVTNCRAKALASPPGVVAEAVTAGDPTGRWLAGVGSSNDTYQQIIWHDGQPRPLDPALRDVSFEAIDRRGDAAGSKRVGSGEESRLLAVAYIDQALVQLASPHGARFAVATGISGDGLVSGWAEMESDVPEFAVMWSLDDPDSPVALRVPRGSVLRAIGITEDGHIAVYAETGTGERSYIFDPDGTRHRLLGESGFDVVEVLGVANGWVVGTEASESGEGHLVRWQLAKRRPEVVPIDHEFTAEINSSGVVGVRTIDGGALYSDHRIDLPPLKGGFGTDVFTIDDDGDAAGYSGTRDFTSAAVRWSCAAA